MDRAALENKLNELKKKHAVIEKTWQKAGNQPLLQFFVEIIPKVLNCERISIFIHDPIDSNLWVQCGTGVKERQIQVPQKGSVVGRAIETGEPVFEKDMQRQMGPHDTVALKTGYVTYNTLCVPVRGVTTNKITGAIQAVNKKGSTSFNEQDLEIVQKMAFNIQMQLENMYLRQEMAKISTQLSKQILQLEKTLREAKK
jgi:transcriptional regulator with GAF, ATPase, and Fis domain